MPLHPAEIERLARVSDADIEMIKQSLVPELAALLNAKPMKSDAKPKRV